jgi:hypothetical protein
VARVDAMTKMMGREGRLVLVNGQHQPVITAAPGAAERWRVINGCTSRVLALRLQGPVSSRCAPPGQGGAAAGTVGSSHTSGKDARSGGSYENQILPSGFPSGSPEEALDCACGLYLDNPAQSPDPPPKNLRARPLS